MIEIYTDGSCIAFEYGGYAALINIDGKEIIVKGSERGTTSQRMELIAAIEGLKAIRASETATIYTDSTYVRKGASLWIEKWKANGWRASDRKPVKNQDLWIELDALNQARNITWRGVKGHSGNEGNERVDKLAYEEAEKLMASVEDA